MNYYQRYYRSIITKGAVAHARGMETRALFNQQLSFTPGQCWRREKDNPAIGIIEGLQFIAGMADKEAIAAAAPHVNLDLFGPLSFYGPRTVDQFPRVISDLHEDHDTRRAVLMIAHHDDKSDTLPCTTSIQFCPQGASLNMIVTMRSSDAVWGLPYDMIQFGMVHLAVAASTRWALPGWAVVRIGNAHVYMDHPARGAWTEAHFSMPVFNTWGRYVDWARDLVDQKLSRGDLMAILDLKAARDISHAKYMMNDSVAE